MFLTNLVSQRRYDVHYIYPLKQANPQFLRSTFYSVPLRNSLRSLSPKMRRRSNSKESLGMFIEEGRNLTVSRQGRSQESTGLGGAGNFPQIGNYYLNVKETLAKISRFCGVINRTNGSQKKILIRRFGPLHPP